MSPSRGEVHLKKPDDHAQTIFERSHQGRRALAQAPQTTKTPNDIPKALLRTTPPTLPEVSELQAVRHFTNLSRRNFSIDTQFYPLGSCTMKYNPRGAHRAASLPGFLGRHPLAPESASQGFLACLYDLQEILKDVTGMRAVSLTPMAGAQGEFAGVAMIRAYHESRKDDARTEILIPNAAHGTNPATAVMCGYQVREVPVLADGDVDVEALRAAVGPHTAGLMMTNPSTCGVFDRRIVDIAKIVHAAGGLLYYDGANLNAILGKVKPGDMGFDVLHMNLHKTFATPHGGGGPGAGPVGVGERLVPFLPVPIVGKETMAETTEHGQPGRVKVDVRNVGAVWMNRRRVETPDAGPAIERDAVRYRWLTETDRPQSIGRLSTFMGNAGILVRALAYALMLGREGMHRVGEYATLNANYMAARLAKEGFQLAYPKRRAGHEFILTFSKQAKTIGVTAMDIAKRLLDYGYHSPTTYFPLLVPECFLIEPTETEPKEELDGFIDALVAILKEAEAEPEMVKGAPHTMPVRRLDDVKAARDLDLRWTPAGQNA